MVDCYCVSPLGDGLCVAIDLSVKPMTMGCGSHDSQWPPKDRNREREHRLQLIGKAVIDTSSCQIMY